MRLTFNSPIDTTARFDDEGPLAFFSIEPADAITIDGVRFSEDLTEAIYDVTHHDTTDYVWILTGARSAEGSLLCGPQVLSYTTRMESGPGTVQGEAFWIVAVKGASCSFPAIAALLNTYPDSGATVAAASAIDDQGTFEIAGVRPGDYWPVLLLDWNGDGLLNPIWDLIGDVHSEVGLYDPDEDGMPEPINMSDSTHVEILLGAYGSSSIGKPRDLPGVVRFMETYPNPSTGDVRVFFDLEAPAVIAVTVYDVLGRRVSEIANGLVPNGTHELPWRTDGFPAGVYVVRVQGPDFAISRQMILLR